MEKLSWGFRSSRAIKKEKGEIQSRYGIKIGQTEIFCSRCGAPWGFGKHVCKDIRLQRLREKRGGYFKYDPNKKSRYNAFCAFTEA